MLPGLITSLVALVGALTALVKALKDLKVTKGSLIAMTEKLEVVAKENANLKATTPVVKTELDNKVAPKTRKPRTNKA